MPAYSQNKSCSLVIFSFFVFFLTTGKPYQKNAILQFRTPLRISKQEIRRPFLLDTLLTFSEHAVFVITIFHSFSKRQMVQRYFQAES